MTQVAGRRQPMSRDKGARRIRRQTLAAAEQQGDGGLGGKLGWCVAVNGTNVKRYENERLASWAWKPFRATGRARLRSAAGGVNEQAEAYFPAAQR
ncbi:hypothetical protein NL676_008266 [Syzygium grande]|nr:hypothetical protein NL676_008266 [Syzygium grande]